MIKRLLVCAIAAAVLVLVLAAGGAGSMRYVTIRGSSMEPTYHQGDLVILRGAASYEAGDVVAYQSELIDTDVMHRIVSGTADAYLLKGDNNSWHDPDSPSRNDIVGAAWIRVPHAGRALAVLTTYWPMVLAGIIAITGAFGSRVTRRSAAKPAKQGTSMTAPLLSSFAAARDRLRDAAHHVVPVAACILGVAVLVGAYASIQASSVTRDAPVPFVQGGQFSYGTAVPAGPVYPTGAIATGDTVYFRQANSLDVSFAYALTAQVPKRIDGTLAIQIDVSLPGGWTRTIPLGTSAAISEAIGAVTATVDFDRVRDAVSEMVAATGISAGAYKVNLVAIADIAGTVADRPVGQVSRFVLPFHLDSLQLRPDWSGGEGESRLHPAQQGSVLETTDVPPRIGVGSVRVEAGHLGLIAAACGLVAIIVLIACLLSPSKRRPRSEAARIAAKYGERVITVDHAAKGGQAGVVDVRSMKDLVRLAAQSDRLVLHERDGTTDRYSFRAEGTLYRYATGSELGHAAPAARGPASPAASAWPRPVAGRLADSNGPPAPRRHPGL